MAQDSCVKSSSSCRQDSIIKVPTRIHLTVCWLSLQDLFLCFNYICLVKPRGLLTLFCVFICYTKSTVRRLTVRTVHVWMVNICGCGSSVVSEIFTKICGSTIVSEYKQGCFSLCYYDRRYANEVKNGTKIIFQVSSIEI